MPFITTRSYKLSIYERGDHDMPYCAIVLPGRLESKDYIHIRSHVDKLAALGFHAAAFDPPGSWESPGTIESYTVTNYLKALNEVIEHLGNKSTLLVGHSLGGSIAMLAGAHNPHVTAYATLMSLVSGPGPKEDPEWKADGKVVFYRDLPPGDHRTATQKRFDLPYSFFEDALSHNTRAALQTCPKPKLFILGKYDTQNASKYPPEEYGLIAEPKRLIEINSHHGYRYSKATIEYMNSLIENFVLQLQHTDRKAETVKKPRLR